MSNREQISAAFEILKASFYDGGKLLLCGNGGSAADCEHIVGELMKGMNKKRSRFKMNPIQGALPAISLCSHTGLITAIANDIGADWIFAQQVYGYGRSVDVLLAISTSGKSTNVINAIRMASHKDMHSIGLTGPRIKDFENICDVVISVPGKTAMEIQEGHIKVYHELCTRLEEEFFP